VWNRIVFFCFYGLFSRLNRLRPANPVDLSNRSFKRILVFSTAGIGDTLTDSVAIRALKESFPSSHIQVVMHRRRLALGLHNPFIDELIAYHKGLFSFFSLYRKLSRPRPDLIVILRANDPDIWPLAFLVNRDAILSNPIMTRFKFLISHPTVFPQWDTTHGVEQTLGMVGRIGGGTASKGLVYEVTDEEFAAARSRLESMGIGDRDLVAFQVGGGRRGSYRDWSGGRYIELINQLKESFDFEAVLTGGKDNLEKANRIIAGVKFPIHSLVAGCSLVETAAVLKCCHALVSTDTGVMHLGFAVGVSTVALIHCLNPRDRVGPYGYGDKHRVIQLEPPPGMKPSIDLSMDGIESSAVYRAVEELFLEKGIRIKGPAQSR
jgi:ADP-heptose:LPS heptosyltransferase